MSVLAGVDGCPKGWLCITQDLEEGRIESWVCGNAIALANLEPRPAIIAIDIPIGLTDSGPRRCDKLARQLLGKPRASSVFPSPIRPALLAESRWEASQVTRSVDGRGVGAQAWNLFGKVRDIDKLLRENPALQALVREVHPELSFMAWNRGSLIIPGKKTPSGKAKRSFLVESYFGEQAFRNIRERYPRNSVSDDDINDAFAALWSAQRINNKTAVVIPDPPEVDSLGLRMGIWY